MIPAIDGWSRPRARREAVRALRRAVHVSTRRAFFGHAGYEGLALPVAHEKDPAVDLSVAADVKNTRHFRFGVQGAFMRVRASDMDPETE